MNPLQPPDSHHLLAAQGWIELGNVEEARAELAQIAPLARGHPDVLEAHWLVQAAAQQWAACVEIAQTLVQVVPEREFGWIHRAYSLHELKRTQEAFHGLLPAVERFPQIWVIPYNLACYCAQLGQLDQAWHWLERAQALDEAAVRCTAQADPDLKPFWERLRGTPD